MLLVKNKLHLAIALSLTALSATPVYAEDAALSSGPSATVVSVTEALALEGSLDAIEAGTVSTKKSSMMEEITRIREAIAIAKARTELAKIIDAAEKQDGIQAVIPMTSEDASIPLPKLRAVYGMGKSLTARIELADLSVVEAADGDSLYDGWSVKVIKENKVIITKNTVEGSLESTILLSKISNASGMMAMPSGSLPSQDTQVILDPPMQPIR